jgi:hypothetical protein
MHDAAQALGEGRDAAASVAEQKAIEALQKGGQAMSDQMEAQLGSSGEQAGEADDDQSGAGMQLGDSPDGQPSQQGSGRPWSGKGGQGKRGERRTDPFGRPLKDTNTGGDENTDVTLPEDMEQARTREIQEELRRRGADRGRPQPELDYIDRLLKEF